MSQASHRPSGTKEGPQPSSVPQSSRPLRRLGPDGRSGLRDDDVSRSGHRPIDVLTDRAPDQHGHADRHAGACLLRLFHPRGVRTHPDGTDRRRGAVTRPDCCLRVPVRPSHRGRQLVGPPAELRTARRLRVGLRSPDDAGRATALRVRPVMVKCWGGEIYDRSGTRSQSDGRSSIRSHPAGSETSSSITVRCSK